MLGYTALVNIDLIMQDIAKLPESEQKQFLGLLEQYDDAIETEKGREAFMPFVKRIWPEFIGGAHHKIMAEAFQDVLEGKCKRLIINMPPRHTKSEFASWLLPTWFFGIFPEKKIIQASHTVDLAVDFGRKVRDTIKDDGAFGQMFPGVRLKDDSQAAGKWSLAQKGKYFAVGVDGKLAGRGADLLIIDDPHSEQEAKQGKPEVFDTAYEWYLTGPRQRLQPNGAIVIVMTRWHKRDLTGRILAENEQRKRSGKRAEEWRVIELPMILPSGKTLWPEFWPVDEVMDLQDEMPSRYWNAQYMQNPTSEEGAILKRGWWKKWEGTKPPRVDYTIVTVDTAFQANESADYTAFTRWGVFNHPDVNGRNRANLILLDAFKDRMTFPQLKRRAKEYYNEVKPDSFIVENKGSGQSLIQELNTTIPVSQFNVARGSKREPNDKVARANSVADIFESGFVWFPEYSWAEDVVTECAEFPTGDHDDYVDCVVMAMLRFRKGGFLSLYGDDEEEADTLDEDRNYYGHAATG